MAACVLGAAAGAFGGGWLSEAETVVGGVLAIEYARIARAEAPLTLAVEWPAAGSSTVLWLDRSYADSFAIDEIRPQPEAAAVGADRVYYTFQAAATEPRVAASFTLRPRHAGAVRGRIGIELGPDAEISQWIFP